MTIELGIRNEELGIPIHPPPELDDTDGWAAFLIPNSYFLIEPWGGRPAFLIPNSYFLIHWLGGRK